VIYFHPVAGYGIDYVPRPAEISQPLPPRSRGVNCGMYDSRGVFDVHLRDPAQERSVASRALRLFDRDDPARYAPAGIRRTFLLRLADVTR